MPWAQGGCCCAVFITTSVLALFCLAAFESIIRPALKLSRSRQQHHSLFLAGIVTFCILSCAGPALHGSFGVTPVGVNVSELVSSQVQLHHPASSPVSPSAMMQSTSLATAEIASSSIIVHRPPALHMVYTSTDSVKRATLPAAIGVSATTMAVWQPHPDTAVDFDAPKAFITACTPASTGPGAQHLPASNHASGAMVLVSLGTVQVVSSYIIARHPAPNLLFFHTYLKINTCADATKSLHCNSTRSSIFVLVVFATHSIQTAALTSPAPMLPATSSAPSPSDICHMENGLHDSVSHNFTQSPATAVTTPQACGTRQAALFAVHAVNTSAVIHSMAQPTALPPGAFNMLGGRTPLLTTANIWPAAPSMIHFMTQPPALLPGSYITPGGRAPLTTTAYIQVDLPTVTLLRTKAQLPALLPGSYIKPGGEAIPNTNISLPYSGLVPTIAQPVALPSSTYSKLDGWAISSEGAGTHLPHQNVTSGEWL